MINLVQLSLTPQQIIKAKIKDNYSWHKRAWDCFEHVPELHERAKRPEHEKGSTPFLSRFLQKNNNVELLIMSNHDPNRPRWCMTDQWHRTTLNESFLSQQSYVFDLYANPTKRLKKSDGKGGYTKNGRRITLMTLAEQIEWLNKKAEDCGFCIAEEFPLQIEKPVNHYFKRKDKRGLHIGVRFRGGIHIANHALFKDQYIKGIGTAKGFGFGMLLIKPVNF